MKASPEELAAVYGEAIAARAFSDKLTDLRKARIDESLTHLRDVKCPSPAGFVVRDLYPYRLGESDIVWIERYEVACEKPLRRALLMVLKGDTVEAVPMAPGETLTDPQLQVDAGKMTRLTALAREAKDCPRATVIDTVVTERPAGTPAPWKERWYVHACGKIVEMVVAFQPSPNGTKIILPDKNDTAAAAAAQDQDASTAENAPGDGLSRVRVEGCCILALPAGWRVYDRPAETYLPAEEAAAKPWPMPLAASYKDGDELVMHISATRPKLAKAMQQASVAKIEGTDLAEIDARYRSEIEGDISTVLFGQKILDYVPTQRIAAGKYQLLLTAYSIRHRSGKIDRVQRYRYLDGARSFELKFDYAVDAAARMQPVIEAVDIQP
jgi:hypothetical protein